MLKKTLAICLLLALVNSSFSRLLIYAGFKLNHKQIAITLCTNKSRPWMHCNGSCFLQKKIVEAKENEKKQGRIDQQSQVQVALPGIHPMRLLALFAEDQVFYPSIAAPAVIQRVSSILVPPEI